MRRYSRVVRTLSLFGAALQLALPSAAAYADARLDAIAATARPHVESHTTPSCTRIHVPDCALCHYLSAPPASRGPITLELGDNGDRFQFPVAPVRFAQARARPHPQPRAPPTLS